MATKLVQALLDNIHLLSEVDYEIVEAVCGLVRKNFKISEKEIKYGGILFCGVFAYKQHVSVAFGEEGNINSVFSRLKGSRKGRRHLKLKSIADIQNKKLAEYFQLALQVTVNA